MDSSFRIPADPDYLLALGRAVYNFTYLEWVIIWTTVRLSPDGFASVPKGKSASFIARALITSIDQADPALPSTLRRSLVSVHGQYLRAIERRNKLLHAHPFTAEGGAQQLMGGDIKWPLDAVLEAAKLFEEVAISANELFHGELARTRP